jgi:hypothetical protein
MYKELNGTQVKICEKCKKSATYCDCENEENHILVDLKLADNVFYHETNEYQDLRGTVANAPDANGIQTNNVFDEQLTVKIDDEEYKIGIYYTIHEVYDGYEAYLCERKGNYIGGTFKKAIALKNIEDNLFFGTEDGVVCSFNFDKRDNNGEIAPRYYSFDDRTIHCGCATKMDCCGIPHLTKSTIKKSTVIKTKSFQDSAAKIKVRTNKKPYNQIARINSSVFSFDSIDFSDFSFITTEQSLFAVKEKEKQWVEKQYYIYSDEYLKPFSVYYIAYRYTISGRYKE